MSTKFSFEVPIAHLNDFEPYQDFHFTLYQLYRNKEYRQFIEKQEELGLKTLWLDNGYNELMKATPAAELSRLAYKHNFSRVVCPDAPSWTKEQIDDGFKECQALGLLASELLIVVNSEEMMAYMKKRGAKHFAYSYWVRANKPTSSMQWARSCHFLGMLNLTELKAVQPPSCDTSMPIKLAIKDMTIRDWGKQGYPHIHTKDLSDFFTTELSDRQVKLAINNIKTLKELVNG